MNTRHLLPPSPQPSEYRFSRFQLLHRVSGSTAPVNGDECKETCKQPLPNTCKLECHSGAPVTDMQEDIPEAQG